MITHTQIRGIFQVSASTVDAWMQNSPAPKQRAIGGAGGGSGQNSFPLDGVITAVRSKRAKKGLITPEEIQALIKADLESENDPNERFVNALARQRVLEVVLNTDEKERLERARRRFYRGMNRIWFSQTPQLNPSKMLSICVLNTRILHYVLTGNRDTIFIFADEMAGVVSSFVSNNLPKSKDALLNDYRNGLKLKQANNISKNETIRSLAKRMAVKNG